MNEVLGTYAARGDVEAVEAFLKRFTEGLISLQSIFMSFSETIDR